MYNPNLVELLENTPHLRRLKLENVCFYENEENLVEKLANALKHASNLNVLIFENCFRGGIANDSIWLGLKRRKK